MNKEKIFESILNEDHASEDEFLRTCGLTKQEIEDGLDCTILYGPVRHRKDGYWLFIDDHDDGASYLVKDDIDNLRQQINKIKQQTVVPNSDRQTPKVAKLFAAAMALSGPFTKKELSAAYGSELGGTAFESICKSYPYLRRIGKFESGRIIYDFRPTNEFYNKLEVWKRCSDFNEEKKAAIERVEEFRKTNFDTSKLIWKK